MAAELKCPNTTCNYAGSRVFDFWHLETVMIKSPKGGSYNQNGPSTELYACPKCGMAFIELSK